MADDFADGWVEFEEFVDQLRNDKQLSLNDIKEYFRMYTEKEE